MAVKATISMFVGEDVVLSFSPASSQVVTSIAGWTLLFTLRDVPGGTTQFTVSGVITNGASGIYTVTIPRASTLSLTPGTYDYDVSRTDSGSRAVIAYGSLVLAQP